MLGFAVDADAGPRYGFEAGWGDLVFTFHADAVDAVVDAVGRLFNGAEKFGIGLLERETHVKVAFLAGLVDPIAALRSGLGSRRAHRRRGQQFIPLFLQEVFVLLYVG